MYLATRERAGLVLASKSLCLKIRCKGRLKRFRNGVLKKKGGVVMTKRIDKKKKTISFRGVFKVDVSEKNPRTLVIKYKNGKEIHVEGF